MGEGKPLGGRACRCGVRIQTTPAPPSSSSSPSSFAMPSQSSQPLSTISQTLCTLSNLISAHSTQPFPLNSEYFLIPGDTSLDHFSQQLHRSHKVLAVDLEANPKSGRVDLVQISLILNCSSITTWLFQPQGSPATQACLAHLFHDPNILKIFHDARHDTNLLKSNFGITIPAHSLLDTQVIYQHLTNNPSFNISLANLLTHCHLEPHPLKEDVKQQFLKNPEYWAKLSQDAKDYAAADVNQLIPATLRLLQNCSVVDIRTILGQCVRRYAPQVSDTTSPSIITDAQLSWTSRKPLPLKPNTDPDPQLDMLNLLPAQLQRACAQLPVLQSNHKVIELRVDLASPPTLVLSGPRPVLVKLNDFVVTQELLCDCISRITELCQDSKRIFTKDNRAVLPQSLHRISGIPARFPSASFPYKGLTYRVGRHIPDAIFPIEDVIDRLANTSDPAAVNHATTSLPTVFADLSKFLQHTPRPSLLLIGPPGVGKTTLLRATIERLASEPLNLGVIVVDTSGEIAGMGDYPHPCIRNARQIHVSSRRKQASVMVEAVQNHMPDVLVIDEIGTDEESRAARLIGPKGVSLVATAHGTTLQDLIDNPMLNPLIGGKQAVILSASEVQNKGGSRSGSKTVRKTQIERLGKPVFDIAIEIRSQSQFIIYHDVAKAVDDLLAGRTPLQDIRFVQTDEQGQRVVYSCCYPYPTPDADPSDEGDDNFF